MDAKEMELCVVEVWEEWLQRAKLRIAGEREVLGIPNIFGKGKSQYQAFNNCVEKKHMHKKKLDLFCPCLPFSQVMVIKHVI